jgi:hypothetical protein
MNEYEATSPHGFPSARPESSATSGSLVAEGSGDPRPAPVLPPETLPDWSAEAPTAEEAGRPKLRRVLLNRRSGLIIAAAALLCSVIGVSVGIAASPSAGATSSRGTGQGATGNSFAGRSGSGGAGSNARSGPASGGAAGTVGTTSKSGFTLTTSAGQKVTIDEKSSTKYLKGTTSTSASDVTKGERVVVLGTTNGTIITATQVIVQTTSGPSATSTAAAVLPFQRGAPTTSKQVGQIPANWSEGQGTIISGTAANKATEAALAAYPGGIVDRVVKLSNGEYDVHFIGVNWPHHVFVNQDFKVVGAE